MEVISSGREGERRRERDFNKGTVCLLTLQTTVLFSVMERVGQSHVTQYLVVT
jgi:hypothetical protein